MSVSALAEITPSPVGFADHLSPCPGERNRSRYLGATFFQLGFLSPYEVGERWSAKPTGEGAFVSFNRSGGEA